MEILSIKELSIYLHCSTSLIRNLVRKNEIPYFRIGNRLNFNKMSINDWLNNKENKGGELCEKA